MDNINVTPGAGATIAADDISGALHQRVKIVTGSDGISTGDVSTSNPLPSTLTAAEQAILSSIASNTASAITDYTATGTITALNGTVQVGAQGAYTTAITVSGTWVGTLVFESQNPGGTWVAVPAYQVTSTLPYQATFNTTSNGTFLITGGGYLNTRVKATAYTSGTVQIDLDASLAQQTVFSAQLGLWYTRLQDSSGNGLAGLLYTGSKNALTVAQSATDFIAASNNSSTTQLAAGATFTGTVENAFNQQNYSILLVSDQPMTLNIFQYIDAAGAKLAQQSTFTVAANTPFARSGVINGNFIKVSVQNTGASTTTTFQLDTAYGTIAPATVLNNGPVAINEINGIATSYSLGLPVNVLETPKATYSATALGTGAGLVPANNATDIVYIAGSSTKTIKVQRIILTATQTTAAVRDVLLIKRSTANTGTSTALTKVPNDSTSAAATASIVSYTANPTVGAAVGTVYAEKVNISTTALGGGKLDVNFTDILGQPVVLRGTAEGLAVNLNGVTSAGAAIFCTVFWTEE